VKNLIRKIIVWKLGLAARLYLYRMKPEVIAITGSAGKTTTKEFARQLLEIDFNVLATPEGYNTEIGAPLALFEEKTPSNLSSLMAWLGILVRVFFKAFFSKKLPDKVIVEMGADSPGDIKYLAKIFKPKKGIVLTVLPVHMLQFENVQAIAKEKSELVKAIGQTGTAFLNYDDELVREMSGLTKSKIVYFGTDGVHGLTVRNFESSIAGLSFDLVDGRNSYKCQVPIFGRHMIYPLLSAIALAKSEHIPIDKILKEVKSLRPYKGRMNILEGIKGSIIIDDSYNANPKSVIEALEFLSSQKGRKIAVLGNMNELGNYEIEGHEEVGRVAARSCDILITVGEIAGKYIGGEAAHSGLNHIKKFTNSKEAGVWLSEQVKEGDTVLVKGSQNKVRLERAVEVLMAHPEDKMNSLVRQSDFWNDQS
jgi:UDP-N-acetylmuramoyl-tripeptide--D-alanyl-D-alanine ligase